MQESPGGSGEQTLLGRSRNPQLKRSHRVKKTAEQSREKNHEISSFCIDPRFHVISSYTHRWEADDPRPQSSFDRRSRRWTIRAGGALPSGTPRQLEWQAGPLRTWLRV